MSTVSEQVKAGLKELPSNVSWLVSKVRSSNSAGSTGVNGQDMVRDVRDRALEKARDLKGTLADVRSDDSVEAKLERAREAARRAEEDERRALDLAREAEALAEHARQVSEEGNAQIRQAEQEGKRFVKEQKAESEREAQRMIQEREANARAESDREINEKRESARAEAEQAQAEAEQAQAEAEEAMIEATESMAEARRLSEEAKRAAIDAAEEASRQAQRVADEAVEQVKATNGGDLESRSKEELLDLAAAIDVPGRSKMSKPELITAIKGSSSGRSG